MLGFWLWNYLRKIFNDNFFLHYLYFRDLLFHAWKEEELVESISQFQCRANSSQACGSQKRVRLLTTLQFSLFILNVAKVAPEFYIVSGFEIFKLHIQIILLFFIISFKFFQSVLKFLFFFLVLISVFVIFETTFLTVLWYLVLFASISYLICNTDERYPERNKEDNEIANADKCVEDHEGLEKDVLVF